MSVDRALQRGAPSHAERPSFTCARADRHWIRCRIAIRQQASLRSASLRTNSLSRGAPTKAGTAGVHGAALGAKEVEGARAKLGWSHAPFEVPGAILDAWRATGRRGAGESAAWRQRLA